MAYNELTFCHEVRNVILNIKNEGSIPAVAWDWTYVGGTPHPGYRSDSVLGPIEYKIAGTYWVYVTTTFQNGSTDLDTFKMNAFASRVPSFSFKDTVVCSSSPNFNINFNSGVTGDIYRYLWKPDDQTTNNITVTAPGNYTGVVYSVDDYSDRYGACDSQWRNFTITSYNQTEQNIISLIQEIQEELDQ